MSEPRGILSRDELIEIIRIRNDVAKRFSNIDSELLNAEISTLALQGGLRGEHLRLAAERFARSLPGVGEQFQP